MRSGLLQISRKQSTVDEHLKVITITSALHTETFDSVLCAGVRVKECCCAIKKRIESQRKEGVRGGQMLVENVCCNKRSGSVCGQSRIVVKFFLCMGNAQVP